jgi:probable O-glycosylation ligase (exosortase A-associated)
MRDIAIVLIFIGVIPMILRNPAVGALAWAWVSIMNPHRMAYGFANSLPLAQMVAGATLISFLISARKRPPPLNGGTVLLVLLTIWMSISSYFSINNPAAVFDRWVFVTKINVMILVTLMLLRGRAHIEQLLWVMVLSIGYFSVKNGIYTVVTGGGGLVYGPPAGMLADNNAFAVGVILVLPFMYYLWQVNTHKWVRRGLLLGMFFSIFSILGSHSRGGLLGLVAMVSMLGLKSRYPVRATLVLLVALGGGVALMPDSWTQRMDTIQTYEADTSAMSRVWTWTTLWNVALDRPLVGAGYAADNPALFATYAPVGPQYDVFQGKAWVAHSIYFQALGEHGFPGLFLFLALGLWIWWVAAGVARKAAQRPDLATWMPLLMRMCQTSLVGFAVGGAFLSLMNLDVPYYLLVIVSLCRLILENKDEPTPVAAGPMRAAVNRPSAAG